MPFQFTSTKFFCQTHFPVRFYSIIAKIKNNTNSVFNRGIFLQKRGFLFLEIMNFSRTRCILCSFFFFASDRMQRQAANNLNAVRLPVGCYIINKNKKDTLNQSLEIRISRLVYDGKIYYNKISTINYVYLRVVEINDLKQETVAFLVSRAKKWK